MIDKIAEAVLYEGYMLYPYRPSTKNRQRWTFGGVFPLGWCETAKSCDKSSIGTQCLVIGDGSARVSAKLRFLRVMSRQVRRTLTNEVVQCLEVDGQSWYSWQEATDEAVQIEPTRMGDLATRPVRQSLSLEETESVESLCQADGSIVGTLVRRQEPSTGTIELSAERIDNDVWRLQVRVTNDTRCDEIAASWSRDEALARSLVSAHVILTAEHARFVSLTDPPDALRTSVERCHHEGLWPVLVGEPGRADAVLASPIILYDYPQIAPESAGDLFDGTEIDEILSLRIMTLSDDEKQAVRSVDGRARALLERTEALDADRMTAMHGTFQGLQTSRERNDAPIR